ncbi:LysR family transcriptional regulator [Listeria innocua]
MKLLHLQYFKKVFETKNVTQAAKELFISQPALSRAIKHLENELGVPLFYHSGRNIETTVYAEEFYPYAVKASRYSGNGVGYSECWKVYVDESTSRQKNCSDRK